MLSLMAVPKKVQYLKILLFYINNDTLGWTHAACEQNIYSNIASNFQLKSFKMRDVNSK